uniref:Hedgehog/Intein (Hint) domain-containing protein n=1 Tax=viral metagenome TaxID=1070528 RepID=A0A6C0I9F3_9ZZZZ
MDWVALIDSTTGINGINSTGYALATQGTKVYVGGLYTTAGGIPVNNIAVWDINTKKWAALGAGLNDLCRTVVISPDGLNVYVGGDFTQAGGQAIPGTAVWNVSSQTWSKVGNGTHTSYGIAVSQDNTKVYVGPWVWNISTSTWSPLGTGAGASNVLKLSPDGTKLYNGFFGTSIGGTPANRIAVCNLTTSTWSALTDSTTGINGVNGSVLSIAVSPDGQNIYASGFFTTAGGIPASFIAKWNTTTSRWATLGTGLNTNAYSIAITPDGTNLYASAGFYSSLLSTSVWNINTSTWSALNGDLNGQEIGIAITSDGSSLYAGGDFTLAGGITSNNIAQYIIRQTPTPPIPEPVICFKEGTKILCKINGADVYIPIQYIEEGMLVKTYKHGYKKCKINMKEDIHNTEDHSINNLYRLSRTNNSQLFEDLYITGSHSILYDNISEKEEEAMNNLLETYNDKFDIKIRNKIDGKYKLIAYYDRTFVEVRQNINVSIYHLVLENENKYVNYGIYANGVLTESIDEISLLRFYNKNNKNNSIKIVNVSKKKHKQTQFK